MPDDDTPNAMCKAFCSCKFSCKFNNMIIAYQNKHFYKRWGVVSISHGILVAVVHLLYM